MSSSTKTRRALGGIVLGGIALGFSIFARVPEAQADVGPNAEVLVIHATNCDKPYTDPAIGVMPALRYNCYKLLDRKGLPLRAGQASTMGLPNGRTFQIALNEVTSERPPRYKVSASISQPDGKFNKLADITAESNKRFHLGGFAYQGGALVLAVNIGP